MAGLPFHGGADTPFGESRAQPVGTACPANPKPRVKEASRCFYLQEELPQRRWLGIWAHEPTAYKTPGQSHCSHTDHQRLPGQLVRQGGVLEFRLGPGRRYQVRRLGSCFPRVLMLHAAPRGHTLQCRVCRRNRCPQQKFREWLRFRV